MAFHGNKKAKEDYLERIRPYLAVESVQDIVKKEKEFISVFMVDDSEEESEINTVYHWNSLVLSNVSESVCIINYAKINGRRYDVYERNPLKTGEVCEIRGYPLSYYLCDSKIENISIGVLDRQFNQYEYKVSFEITDYEEKQKRFPNREEKNIVFRIMDCSNNLYNN